MAQIIQHFQPTQYLFWSIDQWGFVSYSIIEMQV